MKRILLLMGILFFISGCTVEGPSFLGGQQKRLALNDLDEGFRKSLPLLRKAGFGQVRILAAVTQGGEGEDPLSVTAHFVMTTFEIPEGIEGIVRYSGTLRYDPSKKALYLTKLKAVKLTFGGDPSLQEYISSSARRGIAPLIAKTLEKIPVYQMEKNFNAKAVKSVKVDKENLLLEFR